MSRFDDIGGDPRFLALLEELAKLHAAKQADYGTDRDPFANYTSAEEFGIPAWVAAITRANEKMNRVKTFLKKGSLKNESLEDALRDIAVCAGIALVMFREGKK